MGTSGSTGSGRQGLYDQADQQQQGKHLSSPHHHHHHQYPSNSSSSPYHHHHNHHRGWLDNRGVGEGSGRGGHSSQLELSVMDSSPPAHVNTNGRTTTADDDDEDSLAVMRGGSELPVVEREHMFDKVVTPSDVGKLNRLVIPKQHAERYFPLDSSTNEKGLLLNFEDRNGKPWRFRYSYWNSSQSYVMTKGWSRFVKEKKLDAGDIVSFQRGVGDLARDRLFIDWRRRPDAPPQELLNPVLANLSFPHHFSFQRSSSSNMNIHQPWNPMFLQTQAARGHLLQPQSSHINSYGPYGGYNMGSGTNVVNPSCSGSVIYFRSASAAAAAAPQQQLGMVQLQRRGSVGGGFGIDPLPPVVFESVPVVQGKAAAKRLRLFGVNMDCPISEEDSEECQVLPTTNTNQIIASNYINAQAAASGPYQYITSSSNSSSSTIPYLQLSGNPIQTEAVHPPSSSSSSSDKGKASMSLDLDI